MKKNIFNILNKVRSMLINKSVDVVAKDGSAFEFVNRVRYNEDLNEESISGLIDPLIKKKDAAAIFNFLHSATNIGVKDIDKLTDAIIEFEKAIFIYNFALDEKLSTENLDKLTDAIIKTEELAFIYCFARDIKGLSKENLRDLQLAINRLSVKEGSSNLSSFNNSEKFKDGEQLVRSRKK